MRRESWMPARQAACHSSEQCGCQLDKLLVIRTAQTNDRHRPLDNTRFYAVKSVKCQLGFDGCALHGKCVMSALEMVMCQNRAADNRQIRIGADKIVRELLDKIQQFAERCRFNFHRRVLRIEYNAVLVVIYIWRILHKPAAAVDCHRNHAVILPCRMIHTTGIALIFLAQQALGIRGLRHQFGCRNRLRVFFRFG